jgi:UDP-glucuronate 4-epimerase
MRSLTLVTGVAGFIGFHVARRLIDRGDHIIGLDNVNDYYDVRLKEARLAQLTALNGFQFVKLDLANRQGMKEFFSEYPIRRVVHLAAQAGVRYSLINPHAYTDSNIEGFMNILEGCRQVKTEHLVYASSSSVYGGNTHMPFSIHDNVDHPISLYAASKKANELMAHCYAHLYEIPCTGLRFFTVYGPWGRPDMALFLFTKAILEGRPIEVFNHGKMQRDFTYIDDIVEGVIQAGRGDEPCAGADLQYRQPSARGAPALYRGTGRRVGQEGGYDAAAYAAGRRAGHVCGHRRSRP